MNATLRAVTFSPAMLGCHEVGEMGIDLMDSWLGNLRQGRARLVRVHVSMWSDRTGSPGWMWKEERSKGGSQTGQTGQVKGMKVYSW